MDKKAVSGRRKGVLGKTAQSQGAQSRGKRPSIRRGKSIAEQPRNNEPQPIGGGTKRTGAIIRRETGDCG